MAAAELGFSTNADSQPPLIAEFLSNVCKPLFLEREDTEFL